LLLVAVTFGSYQHRCVGQGQSERAKPSILFVGSRHELGSQSYRFLVDPRYQRELEEGGWAVGYAMLSALTWDKLKKFNVVVLQQHPDVERFRLDKVFDEACRLIPRYVEAGGGILVFGDLHRGRIYGNLNRLLKPFGAEVYYQTVEEKDQQKIRPLANYRATKAFLTENVSPSAITDGVTRLWYPRFAQTTGTFAGDENWRIAVRGSPTSYSRRLGENHAASGQPTYAESPPLVAHRTYGKGRIVLFSSHSSWYTLNPYHYMWDEGFFLREGDGGRLMLNAFKWLADPSVRSGALGGFDKSQQTAIFDISPRLAEEVRKTISRGLGGRPRDGVIGIHTRYSGGKHTVDEFCTEAKRLGFDYLVFTEDQKKMNEEKWREFTADCRRNTGERFLAIPGVRFRGKQSGNEGMVFNLKKPWQELPWDAKGFDTFIRLGVKNSWRANTAQIQPNKNPFPYYNQGAINAHTLSTYGTASDAEHQLVDEDWQTFLDTNAYGWLLAPQTYHDIWYPSQFLAAQRTFRTFFHSDRWGRDIALGRDNLLNTSVSNGPLIDKFTITEPGMWMALDERIITVEFAVSSDAPLNEVKLFFGARVVRCFRPKGKSFTATVRYVTIESRSFYLHVTDAKGCMAFSKALPAHRVRYHHFIGGDRMNGYWWPAVAASPQEATHKPSGKWARILGSLYPRLGWGETIGCVSPSQMSRPIGLETGNLDGGVKQIYVSPQLNAQERIEFRSAAPHRTFPLNSTDCVMVEDVITHEKGHYEENGQRRKRVQEGRFLSAHVRTIGFRWDKAIMLMIETKVKFKQDVTRLRRRRGLALRLFKAFCNAPPEAYKQSLYLSESGKLVEHAKVLLPKPTAIPAGGYVALYPHPFGVPAVFAFEKAHFTIHEAFGTPQLSVGDNLEDWQPKAGDEITRRYLFVLTAGGEGDKDLFAQIHDRYGFDGTPAYDVSVERGELLDAVYAPTLRADEHGVICKISKADLPNPLGLRVTGLNGNWDAGVFDLDEKKLVKRVAIYDGTGYLVLDTGRPRRAFIGNLLVADVQDVSINVLRLDRAGGHAIVHNPAPKPVETEVRLAPGLPDVPPLRRRIKLPPGAERYVTWP